MTAKWTSLLVLTALMAGPARAIDAAAGQRVSRVGSYDGYSPVLYDGFSLRSHYVPMRDGARIAIDVIRPTLHGAVVDTKLPVIWMNTPYNRRKDRDGQVARSYPGSALALVKYGYVVAIADMRGNYASFGKAVHTNRAEWMPDAFWDAYDITEWLAAQNWSDSNIGMWGCSATGHSQWQAAATKPPHLKAIFPMSAPSEYYDWNGVTGTVPPPPQPYPGPIPARDREATAVDDDAGGQLLQQASEEHRYNLEPGFMPFRDSAAPELDRLLGWKKYRYWLEASTLSHFREINDGKVPAYETANFGEDQRVKLGVMVKLRNVTNPMKLIFAPGNHCNWSSEYKTNPLNPFDITIEERRWFDRWLKGVRNDVENEPPVYLFTYNRPQEKSWSYAWQWPLPTQHDVRYFFAPADAGAAPRAHAGGLRADRPVDAHGHDDYVTDYEVTPETLEARGMSYTTPAFAADTPLIGHPVLHAWITSTAADEDFFARLADVGPDGRTTMLPGTDDGQLRASVRALGTAPYDNLGLPYHRSFARDHRPLQPGVPTELVFDLAPISWVVKAGHHVRLILSNSAKDHHGGPAATPVLDPAPTVRFLRDPAHASFITLPVNAPVAARVRFARSGSSARARIDFPDTLDARYLADLKPGSVRVNGTPVNAVRLQGRSLVADIAPAALRTGASNSVSGAFGGRYDYGDQTTFTATAAATR